MREKPPSCRDCPAYSKGVGYVPGCGPEDATIAYVGQGPGREEVGGTWDIGSQSLTYRPFIGRSGKEFEGWLSHGPYTRSSAWVDNAVRCLLTDGKGKDREPTEAERGYCTRTHLFPALRELPNLVVVVGLGAAATKALFGPGTGERYAGTARWVELSGEQEPG